MQYIGRRDAIYRSGNFWQSGIIMWTVHKWLQFRQKHNNITLRNQSLFQYACCIAAEQKSNLGIGFLRISNKGSPDVHSIAKLFITFISFANRNIAIQKTTKCHKGNVSTMCTLHSIFSSQRNKVGHDHTSLLWYHSTYFYPSSFACEESTLMNFQ